MSWVAERNAATKKIMIVETKNMEDEMSRATSKKETAIKFCMWSTQRRLVENTSTNGLHKGLITHGRYRSPVQNVIISRSMSIRVYINTVSTFITAYGTASAK